MNSSEPLQPLTPHEERLTSYLDGLMPAEDAAVFERDHPEVIELKAQQETLARALRRHSVTPTLGNRDFFNHQILRQIEPAPAPAPVAEPRRSFSLWRLMAAGAACALAAVAVFKSLPTSSPTAAPLASVATTPKYLAQVTRVVAGDHLLTAKLVNADGLAVVWVEGMDKLTPDYVLQ